VGGEQLLQEWPLDADVAAQVERGVAEELVDGNLNLMLIIVATPNCRVQDIAAALEITVGGTSQAVDRLEKLGHCVRKPNPADRRSSVLELTPDGEALMKSASQVFDGELEAFFKAPLGEEELGNLASALAAARVAASVRGATPSS
jgi:DNA-binding MarR family transcriptional regulator